MSCSEQSSFSVLTLHVIPPQPHRGQCCSSYGQRLSPALRSQFFPSRGVVRSRWGFCSAVNSCRRGAFWVTRHWPRGIIGHSPLAEGHYGSLGIMGLSAGLLPVLSEAHVAGSLGEKCSRPLGLSFSSGLVPPGPPTMALGGQGSPNPQVSCLGLCNVVT